jgi:hypothetical protein
MKVTSFRDMTLCSPIEVTHASEVGAASTTIALMMGAVRTSKMLIASMKLRGDVPEGCHQHLLLLSFSHLRSSIDLKETQVSSI